MTLKDIARLAGVSTSTVSRVINSPDNSFATEAVRNRVWEIVNQYKYTPNQTARKLKQGDGEKEARRTKTITCVFGRTKTPADNPFFAQIARAIEHQALQMGYIVNSTYSIYDINDQYVLQKIASQETDGAVVMGRFRSETCQFFEQHYKNIVYTGLNSIDANWDQVICDGYKAAKTALEYLISEGHHRIAYIGETSQEIRYTAYKDVLKEHHLEASPGLVASYPLEASGGYAGAERLLCAGGKLPSAVFCANDITAVAAIRRFSEEGLKVPKDISVIGIDNIEIVQYLSPMLTTISIPKEEMGISAVRVLIDRIEKGHHLPVQVTLPHQLLVRESTAALSRK